MNPAQGRVPAQAIEAHLGPGVKLPGRAWIANSPRGLIAILHGVGEHCGRYAALAADLVARGFTTIALDLPGHGTTTGPRGDVPSWELIRDRAAPAMFTASGSLPGQPAGLPRVLLGHSMGGVLALDFALAHPRDLAAVVASAPALHTTMPPWWKLALANAARVTVPAAGFPNGLDENAISRDPEVLKARAADPLVHDRISPRLYFQFNEARQRVLMNARRLQVPCLVLQGEADRVVLPSGAEAFAAAAPPRTTKLIRYPDAYHEVFNDPGRERVIHDLVRWLETTLGL